MQMGGHKKISGHVAYLVLYMCCFCEHVFVSSGVSVLELPFRCILIFTSRFQFHLFITDEDFSGGVWYSAWCSKPSRLHLNSKGLEKKARSVEHLKLHEQLCELYRHSRAKC